MNIHLTTERLNIKPISMVTIEDVYKLQSLEETAKFNTSGIPKDINETKITVENWIVENAKENTKRFTFSVELIDGNEFIGLIGINLGKEHYKNGRSLVSI